MRNGAVNASRINPLRRRLACVALAAALVPTAGAMAQNNGGRRGGAGGGRGGMAGLVGAAEMRQVLDEMDLSAGQKTKVDDILQNAQADVRQATQGLRDAAPEERQQKMQDVQKLIGDAKAKVEAELTPDQKAELAKKLAGASITRAESTVAAEKKAAAGLPDVPADQTKQLDELFDGTTKTLDGYKPDADALKDDAAGTALTAKVQTAVREANQKLGDILSQEQAQQVRRAGMQAAVRGNAGGGGGRRGRRAAATMPEK